MNQKAGSRLACLASASAQTGGRRRRLGAGETPALLCRLNLPAERAESDPRHPRRPGELLALCDAQIQKKKGDAVKAALRGTWKAEHLFALKQALALWKSRAIHQGQPPAVVTGRKSAAASAAKITDNGAQSVFHLVRLRSRRL